MSMLGECAPPLQLRRTVVIPPTLFCWALSWSDPGVAVAVGVGVAVAVTVAVGVAVAVGLGEGVGVGVGEPACAQYLPPVLKKDPPQTIISLPVHTAV